MGYNLSMSKISFLQYLEHLAELDEPLGDLASDALRNKNFGSDQTEIEMIDHLKSLASTHNHMDLFEELMREYNKNR